MRELCHWKTKFQASQIILKQYISCLLKTLFLVQIISTFTYANGISQSSSDQIYLEQNLRFHIIEECPLGHLVGTIDTGNNNYRLSAKPEVAELFSFNASTGQLRTAARVDRENLLLFLVDDQVVLNVLLVSDPSQTNNPTIINILISVEDINDNIPTFPTSIQNISIVESTAIGTRFVLNGAQDLDQQGNGTIVEYTLRNNEKNFGLVQERNGSNTTTLFLEIVELIDREEKELYILELEARDGGNPSKKGYCKMQITILDVNDNLPVFDQPIYNVNVSIGAKEIENKSLLTVKAKDADSSENAIVSYKLDGENASLKTNFRIDKTTGEIVLEKYGNLSDVCSNLTDLRSSSANNFTEKLCILKVEAVDHGFPSLSSKAFINVYLSEEMTESQLMLKFVIYPKGSSFASVDETSLNGTVVAVITLINSFGDNATLEITEGNQGGVFRLESGHNFAILRLNQSSAEIGSQQDSFQLEISAIINHVKRVSKKLEVFIRHFNDSAPILQEDIQTVKVAEDLPLGSLVARIGLQPSSYQHSFELMASPLGYESSVFKMDGNFVKLVQPLQLEQSPYKVMVKVSNSQYSFLYTVAQLNVYVVDVNNHSPQFLTSNLTRTQNISTLNQQSILLYSVNLLESHPVVQQVLKLEALDKDLGDNAIVTYSLVKSMDAEMFRVNAQTGQIFLNHPLDYELDKHYFCFEVAAEDSGIPRKSSISAVEVFLEDVNDNPPIFLDSIYYQNLRLSEQQSTKLVKFQAEDADLVDSHQGALTYQLLDAPTNLFQVDAKTGWLSLHSSLPSNYKAGM
uniref:Cadherin domain-containing protein n=1 Tax=Ditylenchus dipsaci TaxID=166011 RepID=A0A915EGL8_9BILA